MKKTLRLLSTLSLIALSGSVLAIPAANTAFKTATAVSASKAVQAPAAKKASVKAVQAPADKKAPVVVAMGEGGA